MQQTIDTWWHELNTWDARKSRSFYRRTLGWTFEKLTLPDGEAYWIARKDGRAVGGIYNLTAPEFQGIPSHWMTYMRVDDIERAEEDALKAGGELTRPATTLPGIGRISLVSDASGAFIGLIEPEDPNSRRSEEMDRQEGRMTPADFMADFALGNGGNRPAAN